MKTKGGYEIENFRKLEEPIENGILESQIYSGLVKQVPWRTGGFRPENQEITWDRFGRCRNWGREDCFIDVPESC